MSHQPFETYIFSGDLLDEQQQHSLDLHLKTCERCSTLDSALNELDTVLRDSASPIPAPGFTQRWHSRLVTQHQARQNRNLWLMTIGLFALAGLMILGMITFYFSNLNWAYELSQAIARVSILAAQVRQFINLLGVVTRALPVLVPMLVLVGTGVLMALSALIFTWFKTIINLYSPIYERGKLT